MKKLFYTLLTIILIILAVATYFGLVPGISDVLGTGVRDLQIISSNESLLSIEQKTGVDFSSISEPIEGKSIVFSGTQSVNATFTGEELTSVLEESNWRDFPLTNTQIKIHKDGTVELAGRLHPNTIPDYLSAHGIKPIASDNIIIQKIGSLAGVSMPVYASFKSSWTANQLSFSPNTIAIGAYQVKADDLVTYGETIRAGIALLTQSVPGLSITNLDFNGGTMNVNGTFPQKVQTVSR